MLGLIPDSMHALSRDSAWPVEHDISSARSPPGGQVTWNAFGCRRDMIFFSREKEDSCAQVTPTPFRRSPPIPWIMLNPCVELYGLISLVIILCHKVKI